MEDEEFEMYRKRIYATFIYPYLSEDEYEECDKGNLREILEEIEKKGFDEGYDEGYDEGVEFWES